MYLYCAGTAVETKPFIPIPARITQVLKAAGTTMKMSLRLFHGLFEGFVMGLSPARLSQTFEGLGCSSDSPSQNSCGLPEPSGSLSTSKGDKIGPPGIIAPFAKKLELEAGVDSRLLRQIILVVAEFDFSHGGLLLKKFAKMLTQ